jgi:hypothetical protein
VQRTEFEMGQENMSGAKYSCTTFPAMYNREGWGVTSKKVTSDDLVYRLYSIFYR